MNEHKGFVPVATIIAVIVLAAILGFVFYQNKKTTNNPGNQANDPNANKQVATLASVDATWNKYTNPNLGFSINVPKVMFANSSCGKLPSGSYTPKMDSVETIAQDDGQGHVFIAPAKFVSLQGTYSTSTGYTFYDHCQVVETTIAKILDQQVAKTPTQQIEDLNYIPYWKIQTKTANDNAAIDAFIKTQYGSGCSFNGTKAAKQAGVYDVMIKGDGLDLGSTKCPLNYVTVLKYDPAKKLLAQWDLGQAATFMDPANQQTEQDTKMRDSFTFLP